jgi:beta-glucosidase
VQTYTRIRVGIADGRAVEIAGDHLRIEYTRAALASMQEAIGDAIDVRGYLHWSLLDNYEWGDYRPTFGLVAVDRSSF